MCAGTKYTSRIGSKFAKHSFCPCRRSVDVKLLVLPLLLATAKTKVIPQSCKVACVIQKGGGWELAQPPRSVGATFYFVVPGGTAPNYGNVSYVTHPSPTPEAQNWLCELSRGCLDTPVVYVPWNSRCAPTKIPRVEFRSSMCVFNFMEGRKINSGWIPDVC